MTLFPNDLTRSYNRTLVGVLVVLLAGYAGLLVGVSLLVRGHMREQIIGGEVGLMHSVTLWELERQAEMNAAGASAERADLADDYMDMALNASGIRGVIGLAVYDNAGALLGAVPETLFDLPVAASVRADVAAGEAVGVFHAHMPLELLFEDAGLDGGEEPMLEVWVPLRDGADTGAVARYWMDGRGVAARYRALDQNLAAQGGVIFVGGSVLITLVVVAGFRRLRRVGSALAARTRELQQLNEELAFAAKSSAVGAIAGHLVHALKNPLASLRGQLASLPGGAADAQESANRMHRLVQEAVAVLRQQERQTAARYTIAEVLELVRERVRPVALGHAVSCRERAEVDGTIGGKEGNLIAFILSNLMQNAVEASPEHSSVDMVVTLEARGLCFRVIDHGGGIDPERRAQLFTPGHSDKSNGSGIGLSISRLLARHLGGDIELERSGTDGTVFLFCWPAGDGEAARLQPTVGRK